MYGCTKSGNTKIKQKGCERMKKITVLLLGVCMLLSGCAKSEQKEGTGTYTNAVSYTHLDVYKRQEYTSLYLPCDRG